MSVGWCFRFSGSFCVYREPSSLNTSNLSSVSYEVRLELGGSGAYVSGMENLKFDEKGLVTVVVQD